jgi:hypothetical protein
MVKYPAPPTHSILPRDRLERRWGLFVGASLFYAVVIAAFMAFVLLCEYPNVVEAANGTEEIIQVIHDTVFEKRWIAYLLLAVAVSPWVIAWGEVHIGLSSSDDEEGNTRLLIAYFIMVMIVGPLLAYLWQPKHLSIDWGNGICFLQGGQSSVYREVVDHLPLIILTSLLALTLYCVIFGNYPTREDAEGETVLASGALLIATTHLLLALTHDFSFTWTACALLSLPTTLLFVGSVIWARQDKLEWYVPLLSFVIFIGWMGVLLTWALTEEYSVAWILIVIAGLAGVLLLVTTAVVSRDKTRVKEVIEEFLQHTPDIDLPRVGLKLIKQPYANTNWVVVNIIIDTLSIIAVALINTIARAGHFLINRVIMPSLETGLYSLLWLLTQLFNLLLIFFAHLVFAITIIPEFLLEVAVIILDALEINLSLDSTLVGI